MSSQSSKALYWRLSRFYFFYFAVLGALIPYWSLYLQSSGFGAKEIGWLTAVLTGTRIVAPNIWGWLADRSQQRLIYVRWGAFLGFFFFLGMFAAREFYWLALVIFSFSFFWNAILAQFEVVTLGHLQDKREHYSRIRLWGSIGFILAVMLLGWVFEYISVLHLPIFITGLLLLIWLSSLNISERTNGADTQQKGSLLELLRQHDAISLLAVAFLLQIAHGPYYVFFSIYLEQHGYSRIAIGQLWSLGVAAEVTLFLVMHSIMCRLSLRWIMLTSLLLTALRWWLIGEYVDQLSVLLFAQCLHAFSFGALHACFIEAVHRIFGDRYAGQGQALYSSASFGAGSAVGASASGYLWMSAGGEMTYLAAAGVSIIAFLVCLVWCHGKKFI